MEPRRFDTMARSLATPKSRRGLLAGIGLLAAEFLGNTSASAQPSTCPPGTQPDKKAGGCRCAAGRDGCPLGCADLKRDPLNCGRCSNACPRGAVCRKGRCECPPGGCTPESGDCDLYSANGGACYTTETTSVCCADQEAICFTNGSTQDRCCRLNGLACQTDTDCCSAVAGDGRCNNGRCSNF